MKYSLQTLSEMLPISVNSKESKKLENFLNLKGFEVESMTPYKKDFIFDIEIPPNRRDLFSHIGFARELSGLMEIPIHLNHLFWPHSYKKEIQSLEILRSRLKSSSQNMFHPRFLNKKWDLNVQVGEKDLCPFYSGQIMVDVEIKESPLWLKDKLESLGLHSVNNVVDVTNWILWEWGQPLHAFDLDKIDGSIQIKKSTPRSSFKTLDDKIIEFHGDELIISDSKKALALAGVIGSLDSGISKSTQNIFIESAIFTPYCIRRIARRFKIDTWSAFYFSRGIPFLTTTLALQRACSLIQQVAGGKILNYQYQKGFLKIKTKSISIKESHLSSRLGYPVSMSEFSKKIKRMNCQVEKKFLNSLIKVTPPSYRRDLMIKEDLIEEWARLKGYEFFNESLPKIPPPILKEENFTLDYLNKIKTWVKEMGFYQAINDSFENSKWTSFLLQSSLEDLKEQLVFLQNPINQEMDSLRQSLVPHLMKNLLLNIRHGVAFGRLFEQGVVFSKDKDQFIETQKLAFILWGQKKTLWKDSVQRSLFFDLKSTVETLLDKMKIKNISFKECSNLPFMHPHQTVQLQSQGDSNIGFIGILHPKLADQNKIRTEVAVCEINLSALLPQMSSAPYQFKTLSKFPQVKRDISILTPQNSKAGDILEEMREMAPPSCKDICIADIYKGKGLPADQKSLTFKFTFQGDEKTLSEDQIQKYQEQILKSLSKKWSIQIRT